MVTKHYMKRQCNFGQYVNLLMIYVFENVFKNQSKNSVLDISWNSLGGAFLLHKNFPTEMVALHDTTAGKLNFPNFHWSGGWG